MTQTLPAAQLDAEHADAIELLGLVAQLELEAFTRLAADSAVAPTLDQRLSVSRFAAESVARRDRCVARIVELGGDPVAAMAAYQGVLDDFDARTVPSTWWERLLKAYVGYGVADDFCRLVAAGLDDRSRAVVLDVLDDAEHAELAVSQLAEAGRQDGALVSRLALWGRRLVGEALGVVQGLLASRPALGRLLAKAPAATRRRAGGTDATGDAAPATERPGAGVFGELTAEHTRRMGRLGLTA